ENLTRIVNDLQRKLPASVQF
ncbi:unnamed protein product, partial [Rotaria sp. Silwood1]